MAAKKPVAVTPAKAGVKLRCSSALAAGIRTPFGRTASYGHEVMKQPAAYLLASRPNGTLYVGVTSNLVKRAAEHKDHRIDGFTRRYGVDQLVWFEPHPSMESAIRREKAIKEWKRAWKIELIEKSNPHWLDLYGALLEG